MKQSVWVAGVVLAAAGAITGATTAFGTAADDRAAPRSLTAAEYYDADMTAEQISMASIGEAGDVAPPCPDAEVVADLKAKGLPVGPCDPLPEEGNPVILPDDLGAREDADAEPAKVCAGAFINSSDPGSSHRIEGPCGVGAEIINVETFLSEAGIDCATVSFSTVGRPEQSTAICVGDPIREGQPNFVSKEN